MRMLRFSLLALVLVISLTIVACAQSTPTPQQTATSQPTTTAAKTSGASPTQVAATPTPQYGGIYVPGSSVPVTLPITAEALAGMGIENWTSRAAYDTLLRLDEKGNLAPFLATDWKIDAPNNTITLTLRKGVKFHDGTDFNAQAVKWSMDLRKTVYKSTVFAPVKSVDVLDDYTVRITLTQFDNTFLPALWFMPSYVSSPTNYEKLGKDKAEATNVGTGPFILKDLVTDDHATYVKNPNYWQPGKPYLDGINYRIIADPTTQELMFRKGEVDIPPIDADIQQRLKDTGQYKFVSSAGLPPPPFWALTPDASNADSPWSNLKVRLAADYAIDKEAIAKKLGGPDAFAQYQWAPVGTAAYLPDLPPRKYDPVKAKQLLAEAGYPNGFKTTLNQGATIQYVRDMELAVLDYWHAVGIDATVNQMTLAVFMDKSRNGWKNGVLDNAPRIVPDFLAGTYGQFSTTSTMSVSMLRPPELEQLMLKAKQTPDLAERDRLAQQVNKYVTDNALTIQIYSGGGIGGSLYQTNIQGVGGSLNYWGPSTLWGPADIWKSK